MRDDLMVQQQIEGKWQHMVAVICLNQTGRKKVKKILPGFFKKFSNASDLLQSDKETIAEMLKDLGMKHVRANRIWRMSEDFIGCDGDDATELFGICIQLPMLSWLDDNFFLIDFIYLNLFM